eukprot:SAG11_NODE_2611_length_3173_cov_1.719909_3_plen_93_part_00
MHAPRSAQNFALLTLYFFMASCWSAYGAMCGEAMLNDDRASVRKHWSCASRFCSKLTVVLFEVMIQFAVVAYTLYHPRQPQPFTIGVRESAR